LYEHISACRPIILPETSARDPVGLRCAYTYYPCRCINFSSFIYVCVCVCAMYNIYICIRHSIETCHLQMLNQSVLQKFVLLNVYRPEVRGLCFEIRNSRPRHLAAALVRQETAAEGIRNWRVYYKRAELSLPRWHSIMTKTLPPPIIRSVLLSRAFIYNIHININNIYIYTWL